MNPKWPSHYTRCSPNISLIKTYTLTCMILKLIKFFPKITSNISITQTLLNLILKL